MIIRLATLAIAVPTALALAAGPVAAHECVNASKKDQAAGAQIVFSGDEISYITPGLMKRIESGQVDLETGEGFHGIVGIDFDGDGVVDFSTYIVGPGGEIPQNAQDNGAECQGIVNIETYFTACQG